MSSLAIIRQRLAQQRLTQDPFQTPAEVVAWLGAVQAQDYPSAKWALGLRMLWNESPSGLVDAIEQAFNNGAILRTHVMRPTWHFVTPSDIRWILELTGPRVNAGNGHMYRKLELDEALFRRTNDILVNALQGGRACTRAEIRAVLAENEIVADTMRLGYILHRAELDRLICSGPRHGKQMTYALLEERAPKARRLPRDEALAELTRRYYTGHGPATVKDFSWWSGLTMADAKAGIEMVGSQLDRMLIDGTEFYFSAQMEPVTGPVETAFLLPEYDELMVGYSQFNRSRTGGQEIKDRVVFYSMILHNERIIGSWRRTFKKGAVVIDIAPFNPLSKEEQAAVIAAGERYAEFLELPVEFSFIKP